MTITTVTEMANDLASAIEDLNHIPDEIRSQLITSCENMVDTLVEAAEEYGDEENSNSSDENTEDEY